MGRIVRVLAGVVLVLSLSGMGRPVEADLAVLSEDQMADVAGGFGLALPAAEAVGITLSLDHLYYRDDDGTDAASQGEYLSLCGVRINGAIRPGQTTGMLCGDFTSLVDGAPVAGIDLYLQDMTIRIDDFALDAMRIGSAPGGGLSFGAIGLQHLLMQVTGRVQIYPH